MAPGLIETGRIVVQDNNTENGTNGVQGDSVNQAASNTSWDSRKETTGWKPQNEDDFAVLAVRNLVLDMTMQNSGGGHGGSAIGMAAIGVALWKHVMRYNPCDPNWFDRDRFVLSNGTQS